MSPTPRAPKTAAARRTRAKRAQQDIRNDGNTRHTDEEDEDLKSPLDDAPEPPEDTPKRRTGQMKDAEDALVQTYAMAGMLVHGVGAGREDEGIALTGQAMATRAPQAAAAWLDLADKNPAVKRALLAYTEGSAFAGIIMVHVGMVMPLLMHRQVVPPSLGLAFGVQPFPQEAAPAA